MARPWLVSSVSLIDVVPVVGAMTVTSRNGFDSLSVVQSTRMYWRSFQGRSVVFSLMTLVCSPVPALYSRFTSKCERILYDTTGASVLLAPPVKGFCDPGA